jgi:hypothetical protein
MRFWLRWAIVTLPVAICVTFWIRSFFVGDCIIQDRGAGSFTMMSDTGTVYVIARRERPWDQTATGWHWITSRPLNDPPPPNQHFGFRFDFDSSQDGQFSNVIDIPYWFIACVTALPSVWLFRRHRKRRKIGFPVEPTTANSKESTPAQTA